MSTTHKPHPTPHNPSVVAATIDANNNNSRYCVYPGRTITATQQSTASNNTSSHTMSSPQSTHGGRGAKQPYTIIPDLHIAESTASEIDLDSTSWMVTTVIEDDDLMFGGKPLSAWYEEDRRRLSTGDDEEEEPRGRQRERVRVETVTHHHHYHHHHAAHPHNDGHRHHHQQHQHQNGHHHAKKGKEIKQ